MLRGCFYCGKVEFTLSINQTRISDMFYGFLIFRLYILSDMMIVRKTFFPRYYIHFGGRMKKRQSGNEKREMEDEGNEKETLESYARCSDGGNASGRLRRF